MHLGELITPAAAAELTNVSYETDERDPDGQTHYYISLVTYRRSYGGARKPLLSACQNLPFLSALLSCMLQVHSEIEVMLRR